MNYAKNADKLAILLRLMRLAHAPCKSGKKITTKSGKDRKGHASRTATKVKRKTVG